jgi:hypothetical protein
MGKTLDIIDRQLELGQTKIISHDGDRVIDYVELLFSPTTKVQFAPSNDMKTVRLSVSDNSLELSQLDCLITKSVLRDYILNLKNIYNLLLDEEENT